MDTHVHATAKTHQGRPHPLYEFCACGHVRATWPSGAALDWHKPSAEKAAEARTLDAAEPKGSAVAAGPRYHSDDPRSIFDAALGLGL